MPELMSAETIDIFYKMGMRHAKDLVEMTAHEITGEYNKSLMRLLISKLEGKK